MATSTMEKAPPADMKKLLLRSYDGVIHRLVSTAPPRDCTKDEIPIIDLSSMYGDFDSRKALSREILNAAESIGFFYIKNHGIPEESIRWVNNKAKEFFAQPLEQKKKAAAPNSAYGYHGFRERQVNPSETRDRKESFSITYRPEFDPIHQNNLEDLPQRYKDSIPLDSFVWNDVGVTDFKTAVVNYWQDCLEVARRLIRILALSLGLPEDYFDSVTKYPGGDLAMNFYPGHGENTIEDPSEVGLGAHTDLQILTLLWQDDQKGLQVLNNKNEWMFAPPIPGTFVVNIGDFLMRLTNDRLKSTVHRVIQHGRYDRFSMPFFFGFNFDEKLGVLPTCVSEKNPAKYEPATCGELIAKRLALGGLNAGSGKK